MTRTFRVPLVEGSTSRFIILSLALISVTVAVVQGSIDSATYSAIVGAVIGGVVHASGTRQGSEATANPPPK